MYIRKPVVIFSTLIAMTAFAGQTFGATTPRDEIKAARMDVSSGKMNAAFDKTELAETSLLNQKQSGDQNATAALDSVEKAHQDLADKNRQAAKSDLDSALVALGNQ